MKSFTTRKTNTNTNILTAGILLLLAAETRADSFSDSGCYSQSDLQSVLSSKGSYIYQTPSYCQQQCAGQKVAAVMDGKYCFCGSTVPASSMKVDSSNCNVACQGYGTINCGGSSFLEVFVNADVSGSTLTSSSSSSTSTSTTSTSTSTSTTSTSTPTTSKSSSSSSSTSTSSSSTSTSNTETSPSETATSSPSDSNTGSQRSTKSASITTNNGGGLTTIVSTVTTSPNGSTNSVVEVTTTVRSSSSTSGASNPNGASTNANTTKKSSSVSGGTIAGAVVGSVAGLVLISLLIFFLVRWRKNREEEDDDDFFDVGNKRAQAGDFDSVPPNTFMTGGAGAGVASSHTHKPSNTDRSYSSNNEDVFMFSNEHSHDNYYPSNGEEYGRRRLSNGSLPDMLTRNPGSLQVVNN